LCEDGVIGLIERNGLAQRLPSESGSNCNVPLAVNARAISRRCAGGTATSSRRAE